MLNFINWSVDPEIFSLGFISIRWYGSLFAGGLLLGYYVVQRIFKYEKIKQEWLDSLFLYIVIATVVGARLGHVIFYGWDYYSENLIDIFKIWEGGLASHGGTLGIIIAMFIYSKRVSKKSVLWIYDRIAIGVALAASMIRLGNLMNSEIIGIPTQVAWAFIFERVDHQPRHPAQLYEALFYLLTFGVMMYLYWRTKAKKNQGFLVGTFLTLVFSFRFFIEFVKENQEAFEQGWAINMGQILSIPFIVFGVILITRVLLKQKK